MEGDDDGLWQTEVFVESLSKTGLLSFMRENLFLFSSSSSSSKLFFLTTFKVQAVLADGNVRRNFKTC